MNIFYRPQVGDRINFSMTIGGGVRSGGKIGLSDITVWGLVVSRSDENGGVFVLLDDQRYQYDGAGQTFVPFESIIRHVAKEQPDCEFCGSDHREPQRAVVAFGVNGHGCLLEATPGLVCDMKEAGLSPVDVWGQPDGVWIWEGHIVYGSRYSFDYCSGDVEYLGEWTKAKTGQYLETQDEWVWG